MDYGCPAVNPVIVFLVGVIVGLIAVSAWRIWKMNPKKAAFFAVCEYWVFLPDEKMPSQDQVMTLMVARNPYAQGGRSPIGPREGLLFSDIRLHCSLVLRTKNPHIFRPDLFGDVAASDDLVKALSTSQSIVKLRYISDVPLADDRHLQFMPHLADSYGRLGGACAIYDVVCEQLFLPEEFRALLGADVDATRPELHLRTAWLKGDQYPRAETKGMLKKGLAELVTADAQPDNQRLVCEVLQEAATLAFRRGELLAPEIVEYFGDRFEVRALPEKDRHRVVHIVRYQAV